MTIDIQYIKYVCLSCNKCLSDIGEIWCRDCFTSAEIHHDMEEKLHDLADALFEIGHAANNAQTLFQCRDLARRALDKSEFK